MNAVIYTTHIDEYEREKLIYSLKCGKLVATSYLLKAKRSMPSLNIMMQFDKYQ